MMFHPRICLSYFQICIILIGFLTGSSYSQTISGRVFDIHTKNPIMDAHIIIKGKTEGAATDNLGCFSLTLPERIKRKDSIKISVLGFSSKVLAIKDVIDNDAYYLIEGVERLDQVDVSAARLNNYLDFQKVSTMERGVHDFGFFQNGDKIYVVGGDNSVKSTSDSREYLNFMTNLNLASHQIAGTGNQAIQELMLRSTTFRRPLYTGYSDKLEAYDILNDSWRTIATGLKNRAYGQAVIHQGRIYMLGGKTISQDGRLEYLDSTVEVYDVESTEIQIDPVNPHQAINFASFVVGDKLILMGGSTKQHPNGDKNYSDAIHFFNFKTGLWYDLGQMPIGKETSGVQVNNKLYLIGGENGRALSDIESFDLETGKWVKEGELFVPTRRPAIQSVNNIIYIYDYGRIWEFNTLNRELKEYAIKLDVQSAKMFYLNDNLYLIGGYFYHDGLREPSEDIFKINLDQLKDTRIQRSKIM